jgi:hypothetical protein
MARCASGRLGRRFGHASQPPASRICPGSFTRHSGAKARTGFEPVYEALQASA